MPGGKIKSQAIMKKIEEETKQFSYKEILRTDGYSLGMA